MDSRHYKNERLRQLRERKGVSQEKVANEVLRGDRRLIIRAEAGRAITYENLVALADYYGVPILGLLYARPKATS